MAVRILLFAFFLLPVVVQAQTAAPAAREASGAEVMATPASARLAGYTQREQLRAASLVANLPLENIGPTVMSGRVVDVEVDPDDPTRFYVAYASGGLWRTTNNGLSFEPLFDDEAVMTLGDIAVDWQHGETIWVGTGENNSSRSSYSGTGIYTSDDGGATWQHRGLAETQHTGRILLHPDDPQTAWVAALGHLYSPNPERGIYKTTDGGATWRKTLFVDENTGAIDLVADPNDADVLYAALWHRTRRAWNFVEAGASSGIYKSTDGGETWTLLTTEASGFPTGEGVGRIGLAAYPGDSKIVYAFLDNQNRRPEEDEADDDPALTRDDLRTLTRDAFLNLSEETIEAFLRDNGFPDEYDAATITDQIRDGTITPMALVDYLEDANRELFDTPVVGAEVYRSDDGGQTWRKTHDEYLDAVYFSYGYYFGEIRVAPDDENRIYIMGVPILKSEDGGATFASINEPNVHVDHHALWVSPTRPGHLINGNDGGLNISWDDGATWFKANTPPVGQFYTVQVDDAPRYRVYGGLQDNGVWMGPHTYEPSTRWHAEGDYPYDRILGGDGMQIEIDARTNDIVYTGFQFGNYFRIDRAEDRRTAIQPRHELGERPLRFNWQTPIHLSRHNQDILYLGSNKLHRSFDRGDTWQALSDDLTRGGRKGDVPYGTLTSIDESPLRFGLLYAGSDDGLIHGTRDGGATWQRLSDGLPPDLWVSRVEASHHDEARVYAALNGYRWDHFDAYVYRSDDYGATWQRLGRDLPPEPVNVVLEDPENADVLYVGTDHGLYVSLDGGASFMAMAGGLPAVPVHDLKIQPRARHLLVGTHGRSIYRADVQHLQQLTPALLAEALHVFPIDPATHSESWGEISASWREPRTPEITIPYYAGAAGTAAVRILDEAGTVLKNLTDEAERGLNYLAYDLSAETEAADAFNARQDADAPRLTAADDGVIYLLPGTYTVEVTLGGTTATATLEIEPPPARDGSAPRMGPEGKDETK